MQSIADEADKIADEGGERAQRVIAEAGERAHQMIADAARDGLAIIEKGAAGAATSTLMGDPARWARRGVWEKLFRELAARGRAVETHMIDSTYVKAHRSASGGKGGSRRKRLDARAAGEAQKSMQSRMLKAVFFPSS